MVACMRAVGVGMCGKVMGKLISATGQIWEGEFKGGKIYKGSGTLVFPGGDIYEGKWVDGKMEGQGRWTQTDGS